MNDLIVSIASDLTDMSFRASRRGGLWKVAAFAGHVVVAVMAIVMVLVWLPSVIFTRKGRRQFREGVAMGVKEGKRLHEEDSRS